MRRSINRNAPAASANASPVANSIHDELTMTSVPRAASSKDSDKGLGNSYDCTMKLPGTIVLDIPPGVDNPRNSEGAFFTTTRDSLIFAYSRFRGDAGSDDAPSEIALIESSDLGMSWSDPSVVVSTEEHSARNVMSVSFLRMANDDIGLFYSVRADTNDLRIHLKRSSDEGRTWEPSIRCVDPPGYHVVNNDRIVRLSSGRIIIPVAFHRNGFNSYDRDGSVQFDGRGVVLYFVSDNDGESFEESPSKITMNTSRVCRSGLQEPGVIELASGTLWSWARTDLGRQYEMFSLDQGNSWTPAEPSMFTGPPSPLSIRREPTGGKLIAVWNPIPNYNGRDERYRGAWTGGRTPLVIADSDNDGRSFGEPTILEDEVGHGYCYTAIHFSDSKIFLAYCAGGVDDGGCLNRLRIRRIDY